MYLLSLVLLTAVAAHNGASGLPFIAMQSVDASDIVRVPVYRTPLSERSRLWREAEADQCLDAREISRARFARPGVLDMLMRDSRIYRARLDSDCLTAGFYSAFYLAPSEDGQLCANRDAIFSRAGSECAITDINRLVPAPSG